MKSTDYITHEEIRERAHHIWEKGGRPDGQDTDHWLQAEKELQKERDLSPQPKRAVPVDGSSRPTHGRRQRSSH